MNKCISLSVLLILMWSFMCSADFFLQHEFLSQNCVFGLCVCVREREGEKERERNNSLHQSFIFHGLFFFSHFNMEIIFMKHMHFLHARTYPCNVYNIMSVRSSFSLIHHVYLAGEQSRFPPSVEILLSPVHLNTSSPSIALFLFASSLFSIQLISSNVSAHSS